MELGRYRIVRPLGQGGMATVYLAEDPLLNRPVAVKVIQSHLVDNAQLVDRFSVEARTIAALRHLNIVEVFDFGVQDGNPFLVMEFIDGHNLQAVCQKMAGGPMPPVVCAALLCQAAEGLSSAEKHGVVHRDIKPENLLLTSEGLLKIADFGIAHIADDQSRTQTGAVLGSPNFMSPEQIEGLRPSHKTDLFSLGGVFYYALSGRMPFAGPSIPVTLRNICDKPHPPIASLHPEADPALAELAESLLRKNPDERPEGARWLSHRLRAYLGRQGVVDLAETVKDFLDGLGLPAPSTSVPVTPSGHLLQTRGRGGKPTWGGAPAPSSFGSGASPSSFGAGGGPSSGVSSRIMPPGEAPPARTGSLPGRPSSTWTGEPGRQSQVWTSGALTPGGAAGPGSGSFRSGSSTGAGTGSALPAGPAPRKPLFALLLAGIGALALLLGGAWYFRAGAGSEGRLDRPSEAMGRRPGTAGSAAALRPGTEGYASGGEGPAAVTSRTRPSRVTPPDEPRSVPGNGAGAGANPQPGPRALGGAEAGKGSRFSGAGREGGSRGPEPALGGNRAKPPERAVTAAKPAQGLAAEAARSAGAGKGFLKVKSSPPFAALTVNGRSLGETPMTEWLDLEPGRVRIELVHRLHSPFDTVIVLQAGQYRDFKFILDR